MTQNQIRNKIQKRAVDLSKKNDYLLLEWATGTGKTLASIKCVSTFLKSNPDSKVLLVCKESNHKKNWIDDIKKHKMDSVLKNMKTILYASLSKENEIYDYIVLDECHAITSKRLMALKKIVNSNTKILFLSATMPEDRMKTIESISSIYKKNLEVDTITLQEAIDMNLLPKPRIIVHDIRLDNGQVRRNEIKIQRGNFHNISQVTAAYPNRWAIFKVIAKKKDVNVSIMSNDFEYYEYLTSQMANIKKQMDEKFLDYFQRTSMRNKFLNIASQRKKFIAYVKTNEARKILDSFGNARHICFTGSVKQSLELGGKSSVNSKNHKDINADLISGFNNKMYSRLYAINMLREGMNLTDVEKGLIVQLDSSVGSYLQMLGRLLRYEFPEIHLIRLLDTKDMDYFERAMSGLRNE